MCPSVGGIRSTHPKGVLPVLGLYLRLICSLTGTAPSPRSQRGFKSISHFTTILEVHVF